MAAFKFDIDYFNPKKKERCRKQAYYGSMEMLEKSLKTKANAEFFGYEEDKDGFITFTFQKEEYMLGCPLGYNVFLNGNFCGVFLCSTWWYQEERYCITFRKDEIK